MMSAQHLAELRDQIERWKRHATKVTDPNERRSVEAAIAFLQRQIDDAENPPIAAESALLPDKKAENA
jgi:hypothetical protein